MAFVALPQVEPAHHGALHAVLEERGVGDLGERQGPAAVLLQQIVSDPEGFQSTKRGRFEAVFHAGTLALGGACSKFAPGI